MHGSRALGMQQCKCYERMEQGREIHGFFAEGRRNMNMEE